jgi:hypothetical protein
MSSRIWHPWRHLAEEYPHITVDLSHELPGDMMGYTDGNTIWLCKTLNQAERRSTLTHELKHIVRGGVPRGSRHAVMREEQIVSELSARQLITLDRLVAALRWTQHPDELAEELWTDTPTVRCRLKTLDPIEVADLEHHLDGKWIA